MANEHWKQFDCYKILNIPPTATLDEIKTAYRRISMRTHPDTGGSDEAQTRVNIAYEILSDPVSRQAHDFYWYRGTIRSTPSDRAEASDTASSASTGPGPSRTTGRDKRGAKAHRPDFTSPMETLLKRVRTRVEEECQRIQAQRGEKIKARAATYEQSFEQGKESRTRRFFAACGLTILALRALSNPGRYTFLVWIAAVGTWLSFAAIAQGVKVRSQFVSFSNPDWQKIISSIATEDVDVELKQQENRFTSYIGKAASVGAIVGKGSSFDDSEEQVARRIAIALFIMGYHPIQFDRQTRVLVFASGDERILVRFRHRTGPPTNVSFVERMVSLMTTFRCQRGYLFCTPGLSGNGAALAREHRITWYSYTAPL